jgi:hypothetical protein
MSRWVWFFICAVFGLALLACGLAVPIHLRAVDTGVLKKAGATSTALADRIQSLLKDQQLGAADLLTQAARHEGIPGSDSLSASVTSLAAQKPSLLLWGEPEPRLETLFSTVSAQTKFEAFTDFLVREENRARVLALLHVSSRPLARELLLARSITNTTIFSPSDSATGQPFDAAVAVCGLLLEEGRLNVGLSNSIFVYAIDANHGGTPQRLEECLLDLMSLGQRFNWGQLVAFIKEIKDPNTLRVLTQFVRRTDPQPKVKPDSDPALEPEVLTSPNPQRALLFTAVLLSANPSDVVNYLTTFSQTGLQDLGLSLRFGVGGVGELLKRNQRLNDFSLAQQVSPAPLNSWFSGLSWKAPEVAMVSKWAFILISGFLIAMALHFARPAVSALERPLQVGGFHFAREILFALGFLLVVLLLSEPFLSQESQKLSFPFRLRIPMAGGPAATATNIVKKSFMNQFSLLTLLLFFVLQGLIYISCLVKLAEIRRQKVPSRIKLKLLENEEHLFDAGLYLGFAGTIISLILVSLGVIQPSLMAAYGSTSFGIVFVSIFKIFNLRPLRRKILLDAEAQPFQTASVPSNPLAAPL